MKNPNLWNVYPPVANALKRGLPVVALESTIVAHGMPFPQNLQLAQDVESILRSKGVEPATIAIKNGQCCIGLSPFDLEDLAKSGSMVRKCSTRDLPTTLSKKTGAISRWGATTVAATMRLAHCAGISTFVTGGIGGVHRNDNDDEDFNLDISADLTELARTPVIVVSAGIKSILDIARTLEVLETNGVPVVSYQCDEFPAFFASSSGMVSPERMDSAKEIADSFLMSLKLGLPNGMLVAVPNLVDPVGEIVEAAIQASVKEARAAGISGRDVTPFILKRVNEITQGTSLRCNMALVKQNARVGAEIAMEISLQLSKRQPHPVVPGSISSGLLLKNIEGDDPMPETAATNLRSDVIVIGGAIIDVMAKPTGPLIMGTSNPAKFKVSDGGVARNVAETLGRLGSRPLFYSAVGDDNAGRSMIDRLQNECGVLSPGTTISIIPNTSTARYLAVMDYDGDLKVACADVDILDRIHVFPDDESLAAAKYLVLDANLPNSSIVSLARRADLLGTSVVFEPTSVPKARDVDLFLRYISFAFPNTAELEAMIEHPSKKAMNIEHQMAHVLARMHPTSATLIVTAGKQGVYVGVRRGLDETEFLFYPVEREVPVANATGAGDTLVGAFIHAMLRDYSLEEAIKYGMKAAEVSLQCDDSAVAPNLSSVLNLP